MKTKVDDEVTYKIFTQAETETTDEESSKIAIKNFYGGSPKAWLKWSQKFIELCQLKIELPIKYTQFYLYTMQILFRFFEEDRDDVVTRIHELNDAFHKKLTFMFLFLIKLSTENRNLFINFQHYGYRLFTQMFNDMTTNYWQTVVVLKNNNVTHPYLYREVYVHLKKLNSQDFNVNRILEAYVRTADLNEEEEIFFFI